jgi:GNAT superfamily N-acetyltransferase
MTAMAQVIQPDLPSMGMIVEAAEQGLHAWVLDHVPQPIRRAALEEELGFWLNTAARDMDYATGYARAAPQSGEPPEMYLDRWLPLHGGAHVLAGPRYLGRDPDLPFVGVSASDRPLVPDDRDDLIAMARESFAAFNPGFVRVTTADPIGAWPRTDGGKRQLVGLLGDLRANPVPRELRTRRRHDTNFYRRYRDIHESHTQRDPNHARHARCETKEDLQSLAERGLLFDVLIDERWAGVLAAEPGVLSGVRGATVIELLLDTDHRGRGYGKHLSVLLAQALPMDDAECLMGTIHADNTTAYHAAINAGRIDIGGEIRIPL